MTADRPAHRSALPYFSLERLQGWLDAGPDFRAVTVFGKQLGMSGSVVRGQPNSVTMTFHDPGRSLAFRAPPSMRAPSMGAGEMASGSLLLLTALRL